MLELGKELQKLDLLNTIGVFNNRYAPHTELADQALLAGLKVKVFNCNRKLDLSTIRTIRKFIKKNDIHIIHSHGYKSHIYAYLATIGLNTHLVASCHNWIARDKKTCFYYRIEKRLLRHFNRVVAVSDEVDKELERIGVEEGKRKIIVNGIDIEQYQQSENLNQEFGFGRNDIIIGTVGRLSVEKGLFDLLRVAKRICKLYANTFFLVVGDGELRSELELVRDQYGLKDRVIFTGQRNDISKVYKTLNIFLMTSHNEGLPMVLLEAMASRVSVITTSVGAIPNLISHNESGLLVEPSDIDAFCDAVRRLIEDKKKAREFAERGFLKVANEYSSRNMALKYKELYEHCFETS